jgi:hypothetical protein
MNRPRSLRARASRCATIYGRSWAHRYWDAVRPTMDEIRAMRQDTGRTILQSFEQLASPAIEAHDHLMVATYAAAVVELYELRVKESACG